MAKLNLSTTFLLLVLLVVATLASANLPANSPTAAAAAEAAVVPKAYKLSTCKKVLTNGGAGRKCLMTVVHLLTSEIRDLVVPSLGPQCCINIMVMNEELGYCWNYLTLRKGKGDPSKVIDLCTNDSINS